MRKILALMILFVMVSVATAQASSVSINATIDGYAISSDGWSNSTVYVSPSVLSVDANAGYEARAALEFDIGSIPSSSAILSAYFNIWGMATDLNIGLHGYSGDGSITEGDFTYSNEITQFDPAIGLNEIDVTAFIIGLFGNGDQYAGFQLRELYTEYNRFVGSTDPDPDYHPELVVQYTSSSVPEPTTLLLLGLGITGLAVIRKKI